MSFIYYLKESLKLLLMKIFSSRWFLNFMYLILRYENIIRTLWSVLCTMTSSMKVYTEMCLKMQHKCLHRSLKILTWQRIFTRISFSRCLFVLYFLVKLYELYIYIYIYIYCICRNEREIKAVKSIFVILFF